MPKKKTPLSDPSYEERDIFSPTDEERQFLEDVYQFFWQCYSLRQEPLDILNHRTLEQFWNDSERDFTVTSDEPEEENSPVKRYFSTKSRNKTLVYISHIAGAMMYPDVVAQNMEQGIDRVWSRVGTSLLYWAHRNDGWPAENGQQKTERTAHTSSVKGTSFCLDIITKDGLESEEIPPEEIYIPNFWQPNIQKQSVVFRGKLNITYEEAEAMFGDLDNFQYVKPGASWLGDMFTNNDGLKTNYEGIIKENKVSVLYVWKMARPKELKELKAKRKVWPNATRGTFYNVIINGIPMFPVDNTSPYKHGFLPISKVIFEILRSDFFYGNSVPNKMLHDKKWRDDWKTLLRYKGKLAALPPQLIIGGNIDDQINLPSAQISVPENVEVQAVPGITGITQSDIQLMNMADSEMDESTIPPSASGQRPDAKQTARAEVIQAAASAKMLESYTRQHGYFMQSRSFHILLSLLQMISRKQIKKIVVPDQTLADGAKGTFEMIFEDLGELDEMEKLQKSFEIREAEQSSRRKNAPKDIAYVSPKVFQDIKFYLFSDSTAGMEDKSLVKQQEFSEFLQNVLLARPDLADAKQALQYLFQLKGWPERILTSQGGQTSPGMPQLGQGNAAQAPTGRTDGDITAGAASKAMTGQALPSLA